MLELLFELEKVKLWSNVEQLLPFMPLLLEIHLDLYNFPNKTNIYCNYKVLGS